MNNENDPQLLGYANPKLPAKYTLTVNPEYVSKLEEQHRALEKENQELFDKLTRAEALVNELECTVADLNEKYGHNRF